MSDDDVPRAGGGDAVRPASRSALDEYESLEVSARQHLTQQRGDAVERRGRQAAWFMLFGFGPAALVAVGLAFLLGQPELMIPFAGVGAAVQMFRIWRENRRIRAIDDELADPIDGS